MADLTAMLQAAAGQAGAETDPNFNQTVLLLHGDGTNGAQNNTFLDGSTNTFTITRNGNTTQGTFSPFSVAEGAFSNYFDGASDYLTTPVSANLGLGSSDFCIEWWEYRSDSNNYRAVLGGNTSYVALYDPIIWPESGNVVCYFSTGGSWDLLSGFSLGSISTNQWVHRALTRSGTTFRGFKDGTLVSTTTASGSVYMSANSWRIGQGQNQGANTFSGYLSNLRMVIGSPVYTSAFTPSTTPLTTTSQNVTASEVELLTCQSNRFVDNSSNSFAITANGNVAVQPFSPFLPSAAYDPSVNGGSGYFDGTGDYLSLADNAAFDFGTGVFCIEAWVYATTAVSFGTIFGQYSGGSNGFYLSQDNNKKLRFTDTSTTTITGVTDIIDSAWHHVVVSRASTGSNDTRLFVDGKIDATGTFTKNLTDTGDLRIGSLASVNYHWNGYIADVRVTKGSIPTEYQTASTTVGTQIFTPATAPLTTASQGAANVSLLTNFTNAGIFDNTGKNNLETVADAQIDTSVKKYGTGSMEFDGTGDYLVFPTSNFFNPYQGEYTVEMWIYTTNITSGGTTASRYGNLLVQQALGSSIQWGLGFNSSGQLAYTYWNGSATQQITHTTETISINTWVHVGFTYTSSGVALFVNGVFKTATALTGTPATSTTEPMFIGIEGRTGGSELYYAGYIDDLRITKGVARYTTTFTPPTAAFPDQ